MESTRTNGHFNRRFRTRVNCSHRPLMSRSERLCLWSVEDKEARWVQVQDRLPMFGAIHSGFDSACSESLRREDDRRKRRRRKKKRREFCIFTICLCRSYGARGVEIEEALGLGVGERSFRPRTRSGKAGVDDTHTQQVEWVVHGFRLPTHPPRNRKTKGRKKN